MFILSRCLYFIQLLGYILSSYDILDIHLLRWNKKEWFPGVWWRPGPLPREIRHLSLHSVAPQSPPTIHTGKPYNQVQSESLYRFQQRGIIMSNLSCVCPKDSVAPLAAFWLEGVALPSVGGLGLVGNVATIIVLRYSFMEILFCIFTTWRVALYQKICVSGNLRWDPRSTTCWWPSPSSTSSTCSPASSTTPLSRSSRPSLTWVKTSPHTSTIVPTII